jgi:hypothetical protein
MGWFGNWLKKSAGLIAGAPPVKFTWVPSISAPHIGAVGLALVPDECYVELYLESLRLTRARKFATTFHALAYSFITLPREGGQSAQLAGISKPDSLAELDDKALDHVITVSRQLMGATPFRGGPLALEFGLFSVKSGNVLTPVVNYLATISSVAGISYVGALKPFLPLITDGMDLIAGQQKDTELEVGVDTSLNPASSFAAAILACPEGTVNTKELMPQEDGTLTWNGKPLEVGYAVFSLRRSLQKPDYGEIPLLAELYGKFQSAIQAGKYVEAKDALSAFRLAMIASADLTTKDAARLSDKAKAKLDAAFPPAGDADLAAEDWQIESLSEIGLYDGGQ